MSDHNLPRLTQTILDSFEEHVEEAAKEGESVLFMQALTVFVEEHNPLLYETMQKYAQAHSDSQSVLFDFLKIYALLQSQLDERPITLH